MTDRCAGRTGGATLANSVEAVSRRHVSPQGVEFGAYCADNARVTITADSRLAGWALVRWAGLCALVGLVVGVGMLFDGSPWWSLFAAPPVFAGAGALSLGLLTAASWWLVPGRVTYSVAGGRLLAHRGKWRRSDIPLDRIESVRFDCDLTWRDLVFSGWFGYDTPMPRLCVTLTTTPNRWDPTSGSTELLPTILLAGKSQEDALSQLRQALPSSEPR